MSWTVVLLGLLRLAGSRLQLAHQETRSTKQEESSVPACTKRVQASTMSVPWLEPGSVVYAARRSSLTVRSATEAFGEVDSGTSRE